MADAVDLSFLPTAPASREMASLPSEVVFLRSVLASSNDCIKVLDLDANLVFMSEGGQRVMEVSDFNAIRGCPWPDFWHGEGNDAAKAAVAAAQAGGVGRFQGKAETMAGNARHWDVQVTPILGEDGKPQRLLSISRDVTDRVVAEERRAELAGEMSHRMKNMLAMVQAIASQTFRQAKTLEEGRTAISGRLAAMARAQDMLTNADGIAADIRDVLNGALAPHRDRDDRFAFDGPSLDLTSQQSLGLSMALHELATNAAKYGALSTADGLVSIEWTAAPDGAFQFGWIETGGPAVRPPTRTGFGTRLIERIVAPYFDGETKLDFETSGVQFRLSGRLEDAPADTLPGA